MTKRTGLLCVVVAVSSYGCSDGRSNAPRSPTAPSSDTAAADETVGPVVPGFPPPARIAPADVAFPPRDQPFRFRGALETKYQTSLNRPLSPTFVNNEGDVVWTSEYLRYRVHDCGHLVAVQRVFGQIDGGGVASTCGPGPSTTDVSFPPRNESLDFRNQLEIKYRDQLRANATQTRVNVEGQIVWTQEYLRYRVNGCGDIEAQEKVFAQIDGHGVQPACGGPCTFTVSPSSGTFRPGETGSFTVTTNRDTCLWFADRTGAAIDFILPDSSPRRGSGTVTFRVFTPDPGVPNPFTGSIFVFGDAPVPAPRLAEFRITVVR